MIVSSIRVISEREDDRFAWSALSTFHNVSFGREAITAAHGLDKLESKNAKKQAEQLRFCLLQAKEYFRAARAVTSAARPTLLYYGVMSLALAQMLFAGDGESSLDFARGQHAHHGLDFRLESSPSSVTSLASSAAMIRAAPLIKANGDRFGTFELWHRVSRECPMAGKLTVRHDSGAGTEQVVAMAVARDERMESLEPRGVTLLECFKYVPGMRDYMMTRGVSTGLGRGVISLDRNAAQNTACSQIIFHPGDEKLQNEVYERFSYEPRSVEELEIVTLPGGCIVKQTWNDDYKHGGGIFPNSFQERSNEIFFCSNNQALNEFGMLYTGIFILGNYARYFPDYWMKDVEGSSPLALSSERFMDIVEARAPLLTASVLDQTYYLLS